MTDLTLNKFMASVTGFSPQTPKTTTIKSPKRHLIRVTAHGVIRRTLKKNQISKLKPRQQIKVNTESNHKFKKPTSSLLVRPPKHRKQIALQGKGISVQPLDTNIVHDRVKFKKLAADIIIKDKVRDETVFVTNVEGEEIKNFHAEYSGKVTTHDIKRELSLLEK